MQFWLPPSLFSKMSCAQFCAAEESCAGGQVVAVAVAGGGQVHMSCCSSCATWAVHSFVPHTMLTQRLYPPPSSLHPLSANSSPHISSSSSGLPPATISFTGNFPHQLMFNSFGSHQCAGFFFVNFASCDPLSTYVFGITVYYNVSRTYRNNF